MAKSEVKERIPPGTQRSIETRDPDSVMSLARLGAAFPSRLSVMPTLIRRMLSGGWRFTRRAFDLDARGVGVALYTVSTDTERTYTLIAFSHDIPPEQRTDRVIAEVWDATFVLYDGVPDTSEIDRLCGAVPQQEAGRYRETDLILSRANRSVRLFEYVVNSLASGRQPDASILSSVGYLMRTSAVYGNGKFGIADREVVLERAEFAGSFLAEMVTVYLIRWFSCDLAEHMARQRDPERAVSLDGSTRRQLGIGNSTGLGMAPFLVSHPTLLHLWIDSRERALQMVRNLPGPALEQLTRFRALLIRARSHLALSHTSDKMQHTANVAIVTDLDRLTDWLAATTLGDCPFDTIYCRIATTTEIGTQELIVSLLIDALGPAADTYACPKLAPPDPPLDTSMRIAELRHHLDTSYAWSIQYAPHSAEDETYFWYRSETKQEPRLGRRDEDDGADLSMPIGIAQQVNVLRAALAARDPRETVAALVLERPDLRAICHRVQIGTTHPYGEVRDNLLGKTLRPIDLLRCKLAVFGATRFDPRSDRWLQVTMFQGAPLPNDQSATNDDAWWLASDIAAETSA